MSRVVLFIPITWMMSGNKCGNENNSTYDGILFFNEQMCQSVTNYSFILMNKLNYIS